MQAYLTDPVRYAGQVVACNEFPDKIFILNVARTTWIEHESSKWEDIPTATNLHPRWDNSEEMLIYGTDKFNFGALPSGLRDYYPGEFFGISGYGLWWSTTEFNAWDAYRRDIDYNEGIVRRFNYPKQGGCSIRCVRLASEVELLQPDGTINLIAAGDSDGNLYSSTKIGTQIWIRENLRTTTYNNGDPIPTNLSDVDWAADTVGAMAVYNKSNGAFVPVAELDDEAKMVAAYGCLYNWHAVNNVKGLRMATDGFIIPTDDDWNTLTNYLISQGVLGVTVGYNPLDDVVITADNVGDALKSHRQVGSPFMY